MKKVYIYSMVVWCSCIGIAVSVQGQDNFETLNILAGGKVIASGFWNPPQYVYEGDFDDADFMTFNGEIQNPAYVGVLKNRRMSIERFYLFGGRARDNGGWFDSSNGSPMLQIMANPGEDWIDVAPIPEYPTLDGTDVAAAQDTANGYQNRRFPDMVFDPPLNAVGIRVIGVGASGNDPSQSHVAVGQLRVFGSLGETVNTFEPPPLNGAFPIGSNFFHPNEHGGSAVGDVIVDGDPATFVHCQENDIPGDLFGAYFGFYSANPLTLTSVAFQHGRLNESGGWFNTEGGADLPRVQIKRAAGDEWEDAGIIEDYPPTEFDAFRSDLPEDIEDRLWRFTFDNPTEVIGVRFVGFGSFNIDETPFIQCAEIFIEGSGSTAFNGLGTGLDRDGNPFQADANGEFFIEGEWARSVNNSYRIFGHGNASSGLVARVNWGPAFGAYSQQELQFDIEVTEAGDYSVFTQHTTLSGWADSYYITFDDQDPMDPEYLDMTNDTRWVPSLGTPDGVQDVLTRQLIRTDSSIDFWTLDAGVHTFRMGGREPLGVLDWILITQDFGQDINAFVEPETERPAGIDEYSLF